MKRDEFWAVLPAFEFHPLTGFANATSRGATSMPATWIKIDQMIGWASVDPFIKASKRFKIVSLTNEVHWLGMCDEQTRSCNLGIKLLYHHPVTQHSLELRWQVSCDIKSTPSGIWNILLEFCDDCCCCWSCATNSNASKKGEQHQVVTLNMLHKKKG